jgi:hypothetical protein
MSLVAVFFCSRICFSRQTDPVGLFAGFILILPDDAQVNRARLMNSQAEKKSFSQTLYPVNRQITFRP